MSTWGHKLFINGTSVPPPLLALESIRVLVSRRSQHLDF